LVEKLASLLDTGVEKRPILHDVLDVFDGEVDKHTSDLRSLGSNDLRDVLVKHGSDLVFVVGVLWSHGVNDLVTGHQVALLHCHLLHLLLLHELLLLEHSLLLSVLRVHHAHRRLTHHLTTMHRGVALAGHWALVGVTTIARSHSLSTLGLATLVATRTTLMTGGVRSTYRALLLLHKVWHRLEQHL